MTEVTTIARGHNTRATEQAIEAAQAYIEALAQMKEARDEMLAAVTPEVREEGMLEIVAAWEAAKKAHYATKESIRPHWVRWIETNAYGHAEIRMDVGEGETKTFYAVLDKSVSIRDRGKLASALWDATVGQVALDKLDEVMGLSEEGREEIAEILSAGVRELADAYFGSSGYLLGAVRKTLTAQAVESAPDADEETLAKLIKSAIEEHLETKWKTKGDSQEAEKHLGVAHSRWVRRNPGLSHRSTEHKEAQSLRSQRRARALAAEALGVHADDLSSEVSSVQESAA